MSDVISTFFVSGILANIPAHSPLTVVESAVRRACARHPSWSRRTAGPTLRWALETYSAREAQLRAQPARPA